MLNNLNTRAENIYNIHYFTFSLITKLGRLCVNEYDSNIYRVETLFII